MMQNRLAIAALLLLLFVSFGCTDQSGVGKIKVMGWYNLIGVAVLVMVLLLSLGYMVAVFMSDDKLKAWTARELGQVFFSVIIVVAVVALVGSLDGWMRTLSLAGPASGWYEYVSALCPGLNSPAFATSISRGRACHIEVATDYLQLLYETARQDASTYLSNYGWLAFLSRLSFGASIVLKFLAGMSFNPFAGLELAAEFFSTLFDLAIKTMFLIRAQQFALDFLWYPLFPVMISMGLVLRVIYFTRKLGGMLIAFGLALYIVFPMFYVLSNAILWGFMDSSVDLSAPGANFGNLYNQSMFLPTDGGTPLLPQQRFNGAKDVFSKSALNIDLCNASTLGENEAMNATMNSVRGNWTQLEGGKWYSQTLNFFTGNAFTAKGPISNLALLMVFTIFTPFLAIMTTLATFKVLSPLLGGDVEISLLSRLI